MVLTHSQMARVFLQTAKVCLKIIEELAVGTFLFRAWSAVSCCQMVSFPLALDYLSEMGGASGHAGNDLETTKRNLYPVLPVLVGTQSGLAPFEPPA